MKVISKEKQYFLLKDLQNIMKGVQYLHNEVPQAVLSNTVVIQRLLGEALVDLEIAENYIKEGMK